MTTSKDGWRRSRLRDDDTFLVVADLHNHTLLSDGRGDPERAFAQMRAAGLDVAALTDHASIPRDQRDTLGLHQYPDADALEVARHMPRSFDDAAWARTAELADAFDAPGEFTAVRGFEWTEPWLGHVNVWFSDSWIGVDTPGSMGGLFAFLAEREQKALFGYNHPGREAGRHEEFAAPDEPRADGDLRTRMVALEAFNRSDDYLFGLGGAGSALVACLDAGWRPGLIGCSDEHGPQFGLAGRGRTGLWVHEHSRSGVRDALTARRSFATREVGLRLDATLDGVPMGSAGALGARAELAVDLALAEPDLLSDRTELELQVLVSAAATGGASPQVAVVTQAPARLGGVTRVSVDVPPDAPWVVLRVADPSRPYGTAGGSGRAPAGHLTACRGLAYASPWWRA